MADIEVEPIGGDRYRVTVTEGSSRTMHEVRVTEADRLRYGKGAAAFDLLRASFEFLLEREPKEAILSRFALPVIERYFPEYPTEIGELLG